MKHLLTKYINLLPILAILIIGLVLCFANYVPQTFLSGWDSLHPEFDFKLNLVRTFFGVFRPEQGLGALSSHAHMVELVRLPVLFFIDLFASLNMVRYLYFFLCLIAGPIGMYYLLFRVLIKKRLPSFLGALFYLLNLGTYQTFLVPLEMFTVLYATLPFVFWLFFEYLISPNKKKLFFFSLIILLAAPAAYASTLWYSFFGALVLFFLPIVLILKRENKGILKRFFLLLVLTILINSFWLLPNIYFAINGSSAVTNANINKLFSDEAFLKNKEFGNLKDILFLKIFYFDWGIYDFKTSNFEQLTKVFQDYLNNPYILAIGYFFASTFLIGYAYMFKTARKYFASFTLLLIFCLFFLINQNFPFSNAFIFLQNHFPLFKEALRFPSDKIINIFVFLVSIFFAYSQEFLFSFIGKLKIAPLLRPLMGIFISILLIIYTLPLFKGNLIHPFMKVTIPIEYFSAFSTLKNETSGRVANFPVSSPWGWVYHDWYGEKKPSYQGAGFMYFGMTSPIMERDFDRWNPLNEQYFREISHAIYTKNLDELQNVLVKYGISNLLVDTSVINPGSDPKTLYSKETFELLDSLKDKGFISKKQSFGKFLTLYTVSKRTPIITSVSKSTPVMPFKGSYYEDALASLFGSYYSQEKTSNLPYLPLTDFMNNESKVKSGKIIGDNTISINLPSQSFQISNTKDNSQIPSTLLGTVEKNSTSEKLTLNIYPQTPTFDKKNTLEPISTDFSYSSDVIPFISFNNEVFPVQDLIEKSPTVLGLVFLNSIENSVGLYDSSKMQNKYLLTDIPLSFAFCNGKGNNSTLNILSLPTTLSLSSEEKNSVCITLPLNFIKTPSNSFPTLVTMDFAFNNKLDISACLKDSKTGTCRRTITPIFLNKSARIQFALSPNELSTTQLMLTVGKDQKDKTLQNMTIFSTEAISEAIITSPFLEKKQPNTFNEITIPKTIDRNYYLEPKRDGTFTNDCQRKENISKKEVENDAYLYSTEKGSYCDHFSFPNLPHSLSYLVYVTSQNKEGLPLSICFTNYTSRRCDIYAKLSGFKSVGQDIFLLPKSDIDGVGYDINIENIGIAGSKSINSLYNIEFIPFPYELLSTARTGNARPDTFTGKIVSSQIINPNFIKINTAGGKTLTSLSYSYDKGFHAYKVSCKKGFWCSFKSFAAPLFGYEIEHVKVDGWKNGWIVTEDGSYVIIFVPQYLEYLGFLFLVLCVLFLIFKAKRAPHFGGKINNFFDTRSQVLKKKIDETL